MRNVKRIATVAGTAALVLFGGLAAVQQQAPPKLNADSLATQLGLSSAEKAKLAPQIDQLNQLLVQADQARQEHQRLWTQLNDVQQKIAGTLTPEQQRGFGLALRRAYGYGWGMGMGSGAMGYGRMGPGAMGHGHMGYGHMGRGHMGWGGGMGYGHGGRGWMMGPGTMGGGMWGGASPNGTQAPGGR